MRTFIRSELAFAFLFFASWAAFGQGAGGTITGTISDPAGAVVPAATVEAKNTETGVVFTAVSSNAGNFTISQVPVGIYIITAKVMGFKTYTHPNVAVIARQIVKEDIALDSKPRATRFWSRARQQAVFPGSEPRAPASGFSDT